MSQFVLSLIVGIAIGGVAGYLGSLMLTKRMALVAGPLGHLTLPGIALAIVYGFDVSLGAFPFVILGIFLIWFFETRTRLPMEALTAVIFASGVSLAFLFLPIAQAETALIGDITAVGFWEVIATVMLAILVFFVVRKIFLEITLINISEDLAQAQGINVKKINLIYLVAIAIVVALGVKMVGGLLTAALVAIPACTVRNLSRNLLEYSYGAMAVGALSCVAGIFLFKFTGLPAGPLIVLMSALFFLVSVIIKKR